MLSRKSLLIVIVLSFFIGNVGMAVMCARLKDVSAGETHTLALVEDNTLWACGLGPLALGSLICRKGLHKGGNYNIIEFR